MKKGGISVSPTKRMKLLLIKPAL
uniref:Uncharacterized protein n=1 Tax=Arundo donax TaxID=35708 RepID=A0A0A9BA15_ARUDO